jgi:flagellar biosynthesis/type III secretory pathway M-ring protein FliF/YscJ
MAWIPGWDSITGSHWWENFYFWASIAALILLGVTEIISHRYTERKDELAAKEQTATQRRHDEEMARLQLDLGKANAAAAAANARTEELRLEEWQRRQPRRIHCDARRLAARPIASLRWREMHEGFQK